MSKHYSHNEDCPVCGGSQSVGVYLDGNGNEQRYCFSTKMGECPSNKKTSAKPLMYQPGSLPDPKLLEMTGLSEKTCQLYRITQEGEKLYFGRATSNGQLHSVLVRDYSYPKKDKSHHWKWIGQGNSGLLYGMDTVQGESVIVTEGFLDAAAAYEMTGIPAVSLPNGTLSVDKTLKECYQFLRKFRTIYIVLDNDEEGINASNKLIETLGYRAKQVVLPVHKVSLQDRVVETKDSFDFLRYRLERVYARALEASKFASSPFAYGSEVDEEYEKYLSGGLKGWSTGIPELDSRVTFRPHEFTILFGSPGRGKSSLARFFSSQMIPQNVKPYFLAFEEPPQSVISGFIPLLNVDTNLPAKEQAKIVRDRVMLGKIDDKITPELLHECLECAIVSYGCTYLVIDHITWLIDKSREPVMAARQYLHVIAEVVKHYPVHILCISHNKPADTQLAPKMPKGKTLSSDWEEYLEPTLRDAQWSSGFEQLSWVILGWKNPVNPQEPGRLYILKDRTGGMSQLGTPVRLYFNTKTKAYYGVSSQFQKVSANAQIPKRVERDTDTRWEGDSLRRTTRRDSAEELLPSYREEPSSLHSLHTDTKGIEENEHISREPSMAGEETNNRGSPDGGTKEVFNNVEGNDMESRLLRDTNKVSDRDKGEHGTRLPIEGRSFQTSASQLVLSIEDSLSRFSEIHNNQKRTRPILPVGTKSRNPLVSFQSPQPSKSRDDTLKLVRQLWGKS